MLQLSRAPYPFSPLPGLIALPRCGYFLSFFWLPSAPYLYFAVAVQPSLQWLGAVGGVWGLGVLGTHVLGSEDFI